MDTTLLPAGSLLQGDVVQYGDYTGTLVADPVVIYRTADGQIVSWDFARDDDLAAYGRQRDWADASVLVRVHRPEDVECEPCQRGFCGDCAGQGCRCLCGRS